MAHEWRRRYWNGLREYIQQKGIQLQELPPRADDRFQAFDVGRRTFFLEVWLYQRAPNTNLPEIGVRLRMSGRDGPAHLDLLEKQSEGIVRELGETPKWRKYPNPDRNLNVVYVDKIDVDVTDTTDWPNQHAWLASKLEKFNKVFRPRIMALNAGNWQPPEDIDTEEESFVEETEALQEQLTREFAETRDVLKSVVEEIRGVREDLKIVRRLLGEII